MSDWYACALRMVDVATNEPYGEAFPARLTWDVEPGGDIVAEIKSPEQTLTFGARGGVRSTVGIIHEGMLLSLPWRAVSDGLPSTYSLIFDEQTLDGYWTVPHPNLQAALTT